MNTFRAIAFVTTYKHWPRTAAWGEHDVWNPSVIKEAKDWSKSSVINRQHIIVHHKLVKKIKFRHCVTNFLNSGSPKIFNPYKETRWYTILRDEMRFLQFCQYLWEVHLHLIHICSLVIASTCHNFSIFKVTLDFSCSFYVLKRMPSIAIKFCYLYTVIIRFLTIHGKTCWQPKENLGKHFLGIRMTNIMYL